MRFEIAKLNAMVIALATALVLTWIVIGLRWGGVI